VPGQPSPGALSIVHPGVGGFHRSRQAMYVDRLLQRGAAGDWGICGVGVLPSDRRMAEVMAAQDCLCTLVTKHPDGTWDARVIGSITEHLFAPDAPEAVVEKMAADETRIVSLTVTEGGYDIDPVTGLFDGTAADVVRDLAPRAAPGTAFGLVIEALDRRRERGLAPFTVVSCANIELWWPARGLRPRRTRCHCPARAVRPTREQPPGTARWQFPALQFAFPVTYCPAVVEVSMPISLTALEPAPAGFDACAACAYRTTGTPAICFACTIADSADPDGPTCAVCGGRIVDDRGSCTNTVCGYDDRYFSRLYTVSDRSEEMWSAIYRFKYGGERDLGQLLGRILVGFLEDNRDELAGYDLITTGAIYVGPRAHRLWDYLRVIVEAAEREGPGWAFAPGLIAKSGPTGRFLGISAAERRSIAEGDLRAALSVPEPERVAGRRILVFDDVYSEGFSLREMARVLLEAGAAEVAGLVFTRRKGG
jgi:predicted amidophosphoribosyltransferase